MQTTARQIREGVERVARRSRRLWIGRGLAVVWLAASALGTGALLLERYGAGRVEGAGLIVACLAAMAVILVVALGSRRARDRRRVAQSIEARHPELNSRLLAALDQQPELPGGRFGFLQQTLLDEVMAHARRSEWTATVSTRAVRRAVAANLAGLAALAMVMATLARSAQMPAPESASAPAALPAAPPAVAYTAAVDPGDVELERGSPLLVLARFSGAVPPEATLVVRAATGDRRLPMARSLDDPLFGARLDQVLEPLEYRVEHTGGSSADFSVSVFERPEVTRVDARLEFPPYTGLGARTIEDTRRVSAVEGTLLTWIVHLNKETASAELVDDRGTALALTPPDAGNRKLLEARIELSLPARFRFRLADDRGRENRDPHELAVQVTANRPPELKLLAPRGDTRVSPLEELALETRVWDDFGLVRYGLSYTLAGEAPRDLELGAAAPAKAPQQARHLLDFEALKAEPDQLVSYHFWAEDVDAENRPRRVFSDIRFAEVRPFDEVFREGEEPAGGEEEEERRRRQQEGEEGAAGGEGTEELAELQKQIISGTWNLLRDQRGGDGKSLAEKSAVLRDSQRSAIQQAQSLGERLEGDASRADLDAVVRHMTEAAERLGEAAGDAGAASLAPALAAEQSAYQSLLRLRAREFEVVRGRSRQRSSSSSSSAQSRAQRQLDQLELSRSRNRYETERSTPRAEQESPEEREDRQVSSRLRDLARRQGDVNERLRELQSALTAAQEEAAREEAERQLRRLREEEQQILRDTDELAERMDRPENQERMAGAREQLGETRESVRQASEALEEGQVTRAAAGGTRAERELEELRDEFRRRLAGRFTEEMRDLRGEAERLERDEQELSRRLAQLEGERTRSLRGTSERQAVGEGLEEQRQALEEILETLRRTVEEAEAQEPLLAEKLYDAVREARQARAGEALDASRQLLDRGIVDEAARAERQALQGIQELSQGIGEAAETVLGDEAEALRRAREELRRLADAVEREALRQPGEGPGAPGEGGEQDGQRPPQDGRAPGERGGQPGEAGGQGGDPGDADLAGERPGEGGRRERAEGPEVVRAGRDGGARQLRGGGAGSAEARRPGAPRPQGDEAAAPPERELAPLGGGDFRQWSDRLRDVEEMIDDPELRAEAARVRDRARGIREEVRRHARPPSWDLVRTSIVEPLNELHRKVSDELLRRGPQGPAVPIDRDPVPPEYAERVREYYERLGSGK